MIIINTYKYKLQQSACHDQSCLVDLNLELWHRQPIASRRYKGDLPEDFSNPHKGDYL